MPETMISDAAPSPQMLYSMATDQLNRSSASVRDARLSVQRLNFLIETLDDEDQLGTDKVYALSLRERVRMTREEHHAATMHLIEAEAVLHDAHSTLKLAEVDCLAAALIQAALVLAGQR